MNLLASYVSLGTYERRSTNRLIELMHENTHLNDSRSFVDVTRMLYERCIFVKLKVIKGNLTINKN